MKNLKRYSKYVRMIGQIAFWLLIIIFVTAEILVWVSPANSKFKVDDNEFILGKAIIRHRLIMSLIVVIVFAVIEYGIYHFYRLFYFYEKGEIFGKENVKHFKALGLTFIYWFIAQIITLLMMTQLSDIAKNTMDFDLEFSTIIIGIAIILIARVMDEGRKLQEEQELTV
ncbi:DUF2975 domain-containing protein [bacterium]|nr:DUF2975 domain-containing protein [bacterium]